MAKNPSDIVYWSDIENDAELKLYSMAAQGFWLRCLCAMARHHPRGLLAVNGRPLSHAELARATGTTTEEVDGWIDELLSTGTASLDEDGRVFNRRMLRAAKLSETRAVAGRLGGSRSKQNPSKNIEPSQQDDSALDHSLTSNTPSKPLSKSQAKGVANGVANDQANDEAKTTSSNVEIGSDDNGLLSSIENSSKQKENKQESKTEASSILHTSSNICPNSFHDDALGWEDFWLAYPRKVSKAASLKAYRKALKRANAETLLAGAKRYAVEVARRDPEHIAHASTWLNNERWLDESAAKPAVQAQSSPMNDLDSEELRWMNRLSAHDAGRRWEEFWGPPPDDPRCRCPAYLRDRHEKMKSKAA